MWKKHLIEKLALCLLSKLQYSKTPVVATRELIHACYYKRELMVDFLKSEYICMQIKPRADKQQREWFSSNAIHPKSDLCDPERPKERQKLLAELRMYFGKWRDRWLH